jgi:flagella basal body P-ring formation protein FlgA
MDATITQPSSGGRILEIEPFRKAGTPMITQRSTAKDGDFSRTTRGGRRRPLAAVGLAALAAGMMAGAALGDHVTLRRSVRLPADAEAIQLRHIAELEGPDAEALADLVIRELAGLDSAIELSVRDVRTALNDADAHWGRINLTGRTVVVRLPRSTLVRAPKPMQEASVTMAGAADGRGKDNDATWRTADQLAGRNSLAGAIAGHVAEALNVRPDRLRLSFDTTKTKPAPEPHGESPAIDVNAVEPAEVRFELRPADSLLNERVTFTVRRWSARGASAAQRIEVGVRLLAPTVTAARDLERGAILTGADVTIDEAWLAPDQAHRLLSPGAVAGQRATRSIAAGEVLEQRHLEPPVVIERGDRVTVRCLVGGVVITLDAEALDDAAEGQPLELRKIGERSTFIATATAPGEATVDIESSERAGPRTANR